MRWMPANIQQLPQSSDDSCLHRVDCSPPGTGTFPALPPCLSGMYLLMGIPHHEPKSFFWGFRPRGCYSSLRAAGPLTLGVRHLHKTHEHKGNLQQHSDFALPFPQHICWTRYPIHAFAHAIAPAWDAHFSFQGLSQSRDIAVGFLRVRVLS